jgi:hypothetical protein
MRHLFGPLRHLNPVVFDSEGGGGGGGNNDNSMQAMDSHGFLTVQTRTAVRCLLGHTLARTKMQG